MPEGKDQSRASASRRRGRAQRFATHPGVWLALIVACLLGGLGYLVAGCGDWTPSEPFTRNAPDVDRAIELYDAGQFESAEEALTTYLTTGPCSDGSIGLPKRVYDKYNGSFDLGLTLFRMAEKYGERFGDEEKGDAGPDEPVDEQRSLEIDCAQIIVKAIGSDVKVPVELRARAWYLSGNLEFLRKEYEAAVVSYDESLKLVPGFEGDAGADEIGRDAAWNRAIALRRLQEDEEQDAGQDDEPDADDEEEPEEPDAGEDDAGDDGGDPDAGDGGEDDAGDGGDGGEDDQDAGGDAGEDGGDDQNEDGDAGGEEPDAGGDSGGDDGEDEPQQKPIEPEGDDAPPSSSQSQMDNLLDELEEAPTYQEEQSKQRAAEGRRRRVMEDK